jgi:hypothetical protein
MPKNINIHHFGSFKKGGMIKSDEIAKRRTTTEKKGND